MVIGIAKTKATIGAITELVLDGIDLAKKGVGLGSIGKVFEIVNDIKVIVDNLPGAMPELQDLQAAEVGEIGSFAYECAVKIIGAIKK